MFPALCVGREASAGTHGLLLASVVGGSSAWHAERLVPRALTPVHPRLPEPAPLVCHSKGEGDHMSGINTRVATAKRTRRRHERCDGLVQTPDHRSRPPADASTDPRTTPTHPGTALIGRAPLHLPFAPHQHVHPHRLLRSRRSSGGRSGGRSGGGGASVAAIRTGMPRALPGATCQVHQ